MKKIQWIITLTILITLAIPITSESTDQKESAENEQFSVVLMKSMIQREMITQSRFPTLTQTNDLPESFSWKNHEGHDWTTPAKHQGNCGSCWDFAAIGAFESVIKIKENRPDINPDLSEQYVLSCLPSAANNYGRGCLGGTPYKAFYFMMDSGLGGNYQNGALPESCMQYQADDSIPCDEKCEDWVDQLIPIANCGEYWVGFDSIENRDIVKELILEYGPIASGINVSDDFIQWGNWNHQEEAYFQDPDMPWGNRLNHIIVIVGWLDDEDITNGGYWICKNSWGTEWGYDGFFNIEYGGLFTATYISWVEYNVENLRPNKPEKPVGPSEIIINEESDFTFVSTDPEQEDLFYFIDWGDETTSEWIGPNPSGTDITASHSWEKKGSYEIRVKVKDIHEYESEWSDPLPVTLSKSKTFDLFYHWILYRIHSFFSF